MARAGLTRKVRIDGDREPTELPLAGEYFADEVADVDHVDAVGVDTGVVECSHGGGLKQREVPFVGRLLRKVRLPAAKDVGGWAHSVDPFGS